MPIAQCSEKSASQTYVFKQLVYEFAALSLSREVVGSIPGRNRPKSLKLVVVAFPLGAQEYGNSTTTGQSVSG